MSEATKTRPERTIFVGRRKTSVARVKIVDGTGKVTVNGRSIEEYLPVLRMRKHATEPLDVASLSTKVDVMVNVSGGGIDGQAGAIRLGIARALVARNPGLRPVLKSNGMLRRDPRMVERKKYGLHKARRGTQFSKR
jgi:small subunit ribosomal protein S9